MSDEVASLWQALLVDTLWLKLGGYAPSLQHKFYQWGSTYVSDISESKLLKVSSDGPNVKLSFLGLLEEDRNEPTCSYWNVWSTYFAQLYETWRKSYVSIVSKLLSSLHRIFDKSASRRADYEALTQTISSDYPLLFCAHCWVKNEQWEQEVWPKIVEVVDFWKGLLKVKNKNIFSVIQKDPVVSLTLQFLKALLRHWFLF